MQPASGGSIKHDLVHAFSSPFIPQTETTEAVLSTPWL